MSLEKEGPKIEHLQKAKEYNKIRHEKILEKFKKSKYWNKELPGEEGWEIGQIIELINESSKEGLNLIKDAPEKIYKEAEKLVKLENFKKLGEEYGYIGLPSKDFLDGIENFDIDLEFEGPKGDVQARCYWDDKNGHSGCISIPNKEFIERS